MLGIHITNFYPQKNFTFRIRVPSLHSQTLFSTGLYMYFSILPEMSPLVETADKLRMHAQIWNFTYILSSELKL